MVSWPYPFWFAHRGAGRLAPENTLAALRYGAACGFRGFECDVKISADGVPFLMHDTSLDRTTTETGRASDRDWAELKTLDAGSWHGSEHAFEPIPSLEQVMEFIFEGGYALNIEIKPTPGDEAATGAAVADVAWKTYRRWAEAAAAAGAGSASPIPPLLSSFKPECLRLAREAAPELPRALLINQVRQGWMDEAQELGCVACVVQHEMLDVAIVDALKARGLKVWVYTVNDVQEAQTVAHLGVDGIITDAVDRFDPTVNPRLSPQGVKAKS